MHRTANKQLKLSIRLHQTALEGNRHHTNHMKNAIYQSSLHHFAIHIFYNLCVRSPFFLTLLLSQNWKKKWLHIWRQQATWKAFHNSFFFLNINIFPLLYGCRFALSNSDIPVKSDKINSNSAMKWRYCLRNAFVMIQNLTCGS